MKQAQTNKEKGKSLQNTSISPPLKKQKTQTNSNTTTVSQPSQNVASEQSEDILYSKLPKSVTEGLHPQLEQTGKSFVEKFVKNSLIEEKKEKIWKNKLQDKAILLDNPKADTSNREELKNEKKLQKLRKKKMSAKERRERNLFEIPKDQQKYSLFVPLNKLWLQYIQDVLSGVKPHDMEAKLLRADLHGCVLQVIRSKNPTMVGTTGILLQETKNTFKIITKDDSLKVVPKSNSVFGIQVNNLQITLCGNNFCLPAFERSVRSRKFRPPPGRPFTIEL